MNNFEKLYPKNRFNNIALNHCFDVTLADFDVTLADLVNNDFI